MLPCFCHVRYQSRDGSVPVTQAIGFRGHDPDSRGRFSGNRSLCLFRYRASIEDGGVGEVMAKPVVIVVGADKGGVGKTTVARTLLDYFSANNVATRAFDTENPRGTLKRFHPAITETVHMTPTSDQRQIFATLNAVSPCLPVIGVRARLLARP